MHQTSRLFSLLPRVPSPPPLSSQRRDAHLSVSSFVAVKVLLARLTLAPWHRALPPPRHGRTSSVILPFEAELKLAALFHAPLSELWLYLNTFLNLGLIAYYRTHYLHLTSAWRCELGFLSSCMEFLGQKCDHSTRNCCHQESPTSSQNLPEVSDTFPASLSVGMIALWTKLTDNIGQTGFSQVSDDIKEYEVRMKLQEVLKYL